MDFVDFEYFLPLKQEEYNTIINNPIEIKMRTMIYEKWKVKIELKHDAKMQLGKIFLYKKVKNRKTGQEEELSAEIRNELGLSSLEKSIVKNYYTHVIKARDALRGKSTQNK